MDVPPRDNVNNDFVDQQEEIIVDDPELDNLEHEEHEIVVDMIDDPIDDLDYEQQEVVLDILYDPIDNLEHEKYEIPDDILPDQNQEIIVNGADNDDAFENDNPLDDEINFNEGDEFIIDFRETFSFNADAEGLNVPLLAQRNLQAAEKFMLILAKTLRLKESYVSMMASFKIDNLAFNNINFPVYMRDFWRIVNRRNENFRNNVVCTICWEILGHSNKPERNCRCGACGPRRANSELGTCLYINLRAQLQALLNKPGMARDLQYRYTRIKRNVNAIEDVYDGAEYRRLSEEGAFLARGNNNYSLAMWTDGVSPVSTASVGIWPVFIQVLELSPRARQRNSLLSAICVGPRKPHMAVFLTPATRELRDLRLNGITWHPHENEEIISRFMTLLVSADSEARYPVFGMMRHNAFPNGCTFFYVNSERIGQQHPPIYPHNDGQAADRTDAEIREDARFAHVNNEPQRGVRCVSAMSIIPGFDLRVGQLVEAMHCLWEGNFVRLFQNLKDHNNDNHITPGQLATISISTRSYTFCKFYCHGIQEFSLVLLVAMRSRFYERKSS